ncbi:hypothetical protein Tco_0835482 [Tanacetum coccineum]
MLHGLLKDATSPVLTLHVDENNVNKEAIAITLAYLYGNHPKLDDSNEFHVLAAASFLDLQTIILRLNCFLLKATNLSSSRLSYMHHFNIDLCAICIDFIISELWTTNFLAYQRDKIMAYMENVSEMLVRDIFVKAGPWISEYERQQLIEEAASLKDKMHKTLNLENEVYDYKRKLDKLKSEKSNLEASLCSVSSSFEELQAEKISFPKEMSEYGNCKNEISALEEKLMRLESDLTRSNDEDIKNEISMIKISFLSFSKSGANETRSQEDIDYAAKIEMLEAELDEALDANKKI